jgi:DNA ligase-associated metallophosphoesterase
LREPPSILAGSEPVRLLPERAVWWPGARTLIAADLHLGKEHAFGALGIAIPGGVLEETLARLSRCVERWGAERVIVVGDLLHARLGTTRRVIDRVAAWRETLAADLWLVPGNHDRAHDLVAEAWRLRVRPDDLRDGPFRFVHVPDEGVSGCFSWTGHLHPAVRLEGRGDSLRLPCFHVGARLGILPAFSLFTGGRCTEIAPGESAWAIAGDRVLPVPCRPAPAECPAPGEVTAQETPSRRRRPRAQRENA